MAHMVVLGPILDSHVSEFAFGNRWYRRITWDRRSEPARWVRGPYPILCDKTYLPYARSYGLFRRVAHWTVAQMTEAPQPRSDYAGRVQVPEDYACEMLPAWTRQRWWSLAEDEPRRTRCAYWAALDIELAYPSVRLDRLEEAVVAVLRKPVGRFELFHGCPETVATALLDEDIRVRMGQHLVAALQQLKVDGPEIIPRDAWGPPQGHPLPKVAPEKDLGIPTGLAISGVLLNVALLEADEEVARYLKETEGELRGAVVRFADDMYVLSRSVLGVLSLIEAVHGALSGKHAISPLAVPNAASNMCLNFNKIKPEATRDVVGQYLLANDWSLCKKEECGQPLPVGVRGDPASAISEWWAEVSTREEFEGHREAIERTAILKGDVGPFVTSLVERLSDMGTETLRQRFANGARAHLARLHELARLDIVDEQVREDTRRTFSANRLVRAWLPTGGPPRDEAQQIAGIRETVGFVLERTPWKFPLWRAVVRAAARRPHGEENDAADLSTKATEWIANQLRRIASSDDNVDTAAWANAWPEEDVGKGHGAERDARWRPLYLSFLRAAFWHALADVIRELGRHASLFDKEKDEISAPPPSLWTVRAVGEGGHAEVAASLSRVDEWVDVLYPLGRGSALRQWPWELDAFAEAMLAIHTTSELTQAWRSVGGSGTVLRVPTTELLMTMPKAKALLASSGRLQQTGPRRNRKLDYWALASVQLGRRDEGLAGVLFPVGAEARIRRANRHPRTVVVAGLALGCFDRIGLGLASKLIPAAADRVAAFQADPLALLEYASARQVIVGQEARVTERPTLHRLLWGAPRDAGLGSWVAAPWETPALGLPSRVGAALFKCVRQKSAPARWHPSCGPLTWEIDDRDRVLASGRCGQFDERTNWDTMDEPRVDVSRSTAWEVLPHAAFYLPFVSLDPDQVHAESYGFYCDALLLLTALDGGERILDGFVRWSAGDTRFIDRWAWRSRIHLPREAWEALEKLVRWAERPSVDATQCGNRLLRSLEGWSPEAIKSEDFLLERIDVGLPVGADLEVVRTIRPAGDLTGPTPPAELQVADENVANNLVVRVGQVAAWASEVEVLNAFPEVPAGTRHKMIEQVANVFLAPAEAGSGARPDLIVLPELAVPRQEVDSLRGLVQDTGMGAIAGLYWRRLSPPYRAVAGKTASWACFVNEAELIVPIRDRDRGPIGVRWFRVRKPVPAHMEDGLARALAKKPPGTRWRMIRGKHWYRFVDPKWGDFTIAICSDLIDAAPWRALRGEILHLLMVAFNKDVDLFDSLTWVRAYENYVNVASVNHGKYGGSFIWTPRTRHEKELARLRGSGLVLLADVTLPVKELLWAQRKGVKKAVVESKRSWSGKSPPVATFKAPPPGFEGRE